MAFVQDKAHVSIDGFPFLIARQPRSQRHIYGRQESPAFVNKFSSGDPNYRDATFYPHFVQNNWLNGFDQEKFADGGKFFRSSGLDPTKQQKLRLQRAVNNVGDITGEVECYGLRSSSSQGWWNVNYGYRQRITITASASQAVPANYPVKITVDTAALQTASKVRSDRNDWRIVYVNGSTQTDLVRDYVSTTATFFPTQEAIAAGQTDNNYYLYYGYSSESTTKQASTAAEYNGVYGMFGTTPDANSLSVWHFREGTGTSIADDSGNSKTLTGQNTPGWGTDGRLGRYGSINGTDEYFTSGVDDYYDLGSFTLEGWFYFPTSVQNGKLIDKSTSSPKTYKLSLSGGVLALEFEGGGVTGATTLAANTWYHLAGTHDGAGNARVWVNGVQDGIQTSAPTTVGSTSNLVLGRNDNPSGEYAKAYYQHVRISNVGRTSFPYAFTTANEPTSSSAGEIAQAAIPAGGVFEIYAGSSNGKIYEFDNVNTWTEVFDARRLEWYDDLTLKDTDYYIGDQGGTERAQAQSFQLDASCRVKGVEIYIDKANGTPSDLQVRIETNNAGVPSGTLADSNLSTTVAVANISTTYGFITVEFPASATLTSATTYWIVLKTAAASNDQNYTWGADASSPSYSAGGRAHSADGGSTWTADSAADFMFRVLGETTSVNQIVQATFSSVSKLYFATGDYENTNGANARIFTYDGTTWVLNKIFTGTGSSAALCLQVYGTTTPKLYAGLAPTAQIYSTSDGTTWALAKDIDEPNNPGYVWDMEVYNGRLYAGGGHPEYVNTNNSGGFLYSFDEFSWDFVHNFNFTVVKSLCVYDSLLFVGTINKNLFVYNTASMDKLLEFPWDVSIEEMAVHEDKLAIALGATNALTGQEGVYLFDRNGFHKAFTPAAIGYKALLSARNQLLVGGTSVTSYQTSSNTYQASGTAQLSYFEASLPSIYKLFRDVTLQYEALPSGGSILLEYKTDESDDDWTTVGTADTVGSTEETFTFAVAFYAKKISYRVTIASSDSSSTPVLTLIDTRYILSPDFKYLWKFSVVCPDNLQWIDGTRPYTTTAEAITADETELDLTNAEGFPTKGRAVVVGSDGTEDEFTWTGKSTNTLTGCSGLSAHSSSGLVVKITGKMLHKQLLALKQARTFYTYVDIDGNSYTVVFNNYQEDNFVIDQSQGIENNVPITLLEA